jgi:hypothetical protein
MSSHENDNACVKRHDGTVSPRHWDSNACENHFSNIKRTLKLGHAAAPNIRMGSVRFDSMKIRPGLDCDIITNCHIGLDTHVQLNVIERTFKQDLAKKEVRSLFRVSSFLQSLCYIHR